MSAVDTPRGSRRDAIGSGRCFLVSLTLRCSYGLVARLTLLRLGPAVTLGLEVTGGDRLSAVSASLVGASPSRS